MWATGGGLCTSPPPLAMHAEHKDESGGQLDDLFCPFYQTKYVLAANNKKEEPCKFSSIHPRHHAPIGGGAVASAGGTMVSEYMR